MKCIHSISTAFRTFTFLILSLFSANSMAGLVNIDFNALAGSGGLVTTPYVENGFIFTPSCHYDEGLPSAFFQLTDPWFGFDLSGCLSDPEATVRMETVSGQNFDLLFLENAATPDYEIRSSRGGLMFPTPRIVEVGGVPVIDGETYFSGNQWRDLEWVEFATTVGEPTGFDNVLVNAINLPPSLTLFAFALLLARRKKKTSDPDYERHQ